MIIPSKPLNRRTLLRATGVTIGLPLLEAMAPVGKTAFAQSQQPARFMTCFTPVGMYSPAFFPNVGKLDNLPPTLQPLSKHTNDFLVLDNVYNKAEDPEITGKNDGGAHGPGTGCFLTGERPRKSGIYNGVSVDQVMAEYLKGKTPFDSLQLGVEDMGRAGPGGNCDAGFACAYMYHISWNKAGNYMPNTTDPVKLFNKLYGKVQGGVGTVMPSAGDNIDKSVLDYVLSDIKKLQTKLGQSDTEKLNEYLASVRSVEADLASTGGVSGACNLKDTPRVTESGGGKRAQQVIDLHVQLSVMAFQCDLTRVITLMFDRGASQRKYNDLFSGHVDNHHSYSHHQGKKSNIDKLLQVEKWEIERYSRLLDLMKSTKDASGKSLLDSSTVYLSNEINEGMKHRYQRMPVLIAGNANGQMKTGECIRLPDSRRDFCDIYETFLHFIGDTNHGRFGKFGGGKVSQIMI